MGGDFTLITTLRENKGGRRVLDKYQDEFKELLAHSSLVDLETGDGWFTWNNRRGGEHLVASWLDRFLVLENISSGSGEIYINVLPVAGSNHWPICLNWDVMNTLLSNTFHFERFWLEHKDFKGLVHQW